MKRFTLLSLAIMFSLTLSAQEQESQSEHKYIIREDRVWEYVREFSPAYSDWQRFDYIKVKFDGTEIINGEEYSKLIAVDLYQALFEYYDYTTSTVYETPKITISELEMPDWLPAYLREEDGKLYSYSMFDAEYCQNYGFDYQEQLVYDFSLVENEKFDGAVYYSELLGCDPISFRVTNTGVRTINNEECVELGVMPLTSFDLWNSSYSPADLRLIEGIGLVDVYSNNTTGTIVQIEATVFNTGMFQQYSHCLNNVYNLDGNVIFNGYNLNIPTGIKDFSDDGNTEPVYYNLQGMEIEKPERGLYIERRNGRSIKHVK